MALGIVGKKHGMTRVFTDTGEAVPVTVIEAAPNRVTQVKTLERDGYRAVQVTAGSRSRRRIGKPAAGILARAQIETGAGFWEFRLGDGDGEGDGLETGAEITVAQFEQGQRVDVAGTSKGKGFAGTIKRHNFRSQDATHGNSLSHRAPGATGQNQSPGRVFKGKKMAGQMGNERCSALNLEILRVDAERNLLLVRGAVPGAKGGRVVIRPTTKARR